MEKYLIIFFPEEGNTLATLSLTSLAPLSLLHHTFKLVSTTTSLEVKQKTPPGEGTKRKPKERYKKTQKREQKKTQKKGNRLIKTISYSLYPQLFYNLCHTQSVLTVRLLHKTQDYQLLHHFLPEQSAL